MPLSDEDAFVKLQVMYDEYDDATAMYDKVSYAQKGDEVYTTLYDSHRRNKRKNPEKCTEHDLHVLSERWNKQCTRLASQCEKLQDQLEQNGFGEHVRALLVNKRIRPQVREAETDSAQMKLKKDVDKYLNATNPVIENESANVSYVQFPGAKGYVYDDARNEANAHVDVLDDSEPLGQGDIVPDVARLFDDDDDEKERTAPKMVYSSGAKWVSGHRIPGDLVSTLHDHQIDCVEFSLSAFARDEGVLVSHAMGTGKTLTVLATLETIRSLDDNARAVVTCPSGMIQPWLDETERWKDVLSFDSFRFGGDDSLREQRLWKRHGGLLVMSHNAFRDWAPTVTFDANVVVVVDEAHLLLKSGTTQFCKALRDIGTMRRMLLSGTPLQNNLTEFYNMVELVSPGLLASTPSDFKRTYTNVIECGMMRDSTEEQRQAKDSAIYKLRVAVSNVMHDQNDELLKQRLFGKHEFKLVYTSDIEVHVDPSIGVIAERPRVSSALRPARVRVVCSLIDSIRNRNPNDNLVVFSPFLDTLRSLSTMCYGELYTGEVTKVQRSKILSDFADGTGGNILYVTTLAGGVGINLTAANRVILAEMSWNPADDAQALSRCYRMGQTKPVYAYRVVAGKTLEERIMRLQHKKTGQTLRVLEERDFDALYTREDMKELTEVDDDVMLSKSELKKRDPALNDFVKAIDGVEVSDYAASFDNDDAEMTDHARQEAVNEMQEKRRMAPRTLLSPDDTFQKVSPGQFFFEGDYSSVMVPPYMPYMEKPMVSETLLEQVGRDRAKWVPNVLGTVNDKIWLRLGPFVDRSTSMALEVDDACRFEVAYSQIDIETPKFKILKQRFMVDTLGTAALRFPVGPFDVGSFVFKARFVNERTGEKSDWSEQSATFIVHDGEDSDDDSDDDE